MLLCTPIVGRSDPASRRGWMSSPTNPSCSGRFTSKWRACPWPLRTTLSVMLFQLRSPLPSIATISSPARMPAS